MTPTDSPLALLYSLLAFLRGAHTLPLSVALNTLPGTPASVITSVVSSAALHASILYDAEELRATIPGVDRFKVAAQKNASTWWRGTLKLLPEESVGVRGYEPGSKTLEAIPGDDGWVSVDSTSKSVMVEGPFSYLVSSLVSRFESNFVVAPLRSPLSPLAPSSSPSIDIIIIRPMRDIETAKLVAEGQSEEAAKAFVAKVWGVMGGMYSGGTHVDVEYADQKLSIVEVFRCGGFVWEPVSSFARSLMLLLTILAGTERRRQEQSRLPGWSGARSRARREALDDRSRVRADWVARMVLETACIGHQEYLHRSPHSSSSSSVTGSSSSPSCPTTSSTSISASPHT